MLKASSRTTRKIKPALLWSCPINQAYSIHWQLGLIGIRVQDLTADVVVDFTDHNLESCLDIGRIECWCLHEEQAFCFCKTLALLYAHLSYILQITLVSHQHSCYGAIILSCKFLQESNSVKKLYGKQNYDKN